MRHVLSWVKFLLAKAMRRGRLPALRNCTIHPTSRVLGGSQLTNVVMGRYSYCSYDCIMTEVDIGSFCSIAGKVFIGGAEHPLSFVSTSPVFSEGNNCMKRNFQKLAYSPTRRTTIGHDVWIGDAVCVKGGVTIGNGAVIGMGSVVVRDIPPYTIWAGNPAREIRKRFSDEVISGLQRSRWWECSDERLQEVSNEFDDVERFLEPPQ